jgi:hypothetical protein
MKNILTITLLVCCVAWMPSVKAQKTTTTTTTTTGKKTNGKLTPIQFSDRMSDITDSLYARGSAWGTQFNDARKSKNFSSLKPYRVAVDNFITRSLNSLRNMEDVKDSKALRMAMISFLQYEHKMVTEGFIPIEQIKADASDAEVDKALSGLTDLSEKENAELKKVATEQEAYAAANGFKIESEEEAGEQTEK